jgi:hypothetical protein
MSDIGLHGSIYEQLRQYADRLDRALIGLRNPNVDAALQSRKEIAWLLRDITNNRSTSAASQFIAIILSQELPSTLGQGLTICESLASTLERRSPSAPELTQLEQIAMAIDKECASTLARIKGRA